MPCTMQRRVLVDEDAHAALPPFASCHRLLHRLVHVGRRREAVLLRIFIAISSFVPVRRMTIGTLSGFCFVAVTMPFATSSVRVMPPKMLNRIDLHARVGGDDAERVDDLLGIRRAADVEEVRRLAAVVLHEVHRRHREAGAVHDAADVAVELDEREVRVARLDFARLLGASRRAARRARGGDRARCRRSTIFASSASTSPAGVTTSGLISASEQPFFMNAV